MTTPPLPCDGCSQPAGSTHIARRLERLAWSTRFRPLHIQALLLAPIAPEQNADFLYAPDSAFTGEAAAILSAVEVNPTGKSVDAVLSEFQKLGLLLTHVLECPLDPGANPNTFFAAQLPSVIARIRRSLKPKRVLLLGDALAPYAAKFQDANFVSPVLPAQGVLLPSFPGQTQTDPSLAAFRDALALPQSRTA